MPDGGSRHAAAGDEGPTWAASETNQGCYSIRLLKRRERHSLRRCCERERKGNSDQPDHCSLLCELFKKVPWQEINRRAIKIIGRAVSNGLTGVQVYRLPSQLCTDRGPSDPYGPSCWGEVPGFNRCRESATHAQCREVRRMRCIVSTLVTARGRAAPPALKRFPFERTQDVCHSPCSVIAGLDPAIHLLRKSILRRRWTRGSSPRVTTENGEALSQCEREPL
jgi:hypothetical protein